MIVPAERSSLGRQVTFRFSRDKFLAAAELAVQRLHHPHGKWTLDGYNSRHLFLRLLTNPTILKTHSYLPQYVDQAFDLAFNDQSVTLSINTSSADVVATFDALAEALDQQLQRG